MWQEIEQRIDKVLDIRLSWFFTRVFKKIFKQIERLQLFVWNLEMGPTQHGLKMVYHRRTCVCSTPHFRSSTIKFLFVLFCNYLFYLFPGLDTTTKTFCIFNSFCKLWSHITSLSTGFFLEPSTISLAQCQASDTRFDGGLRQVFYTFLFVCFF